MKYPYQNIEKKWQEIWQKNKAFEASDLDKQKEKFYLLVEFPYPSGKGLHVGHPRPYVALDVIARKRRMQGYNVIYPIGWDAFGLPTENFAIKHKIHPKVVTKNNIENFKRQVKSLGISFDWSREINTTDPEYYRWTQWMFLQFFKHGLAYKQEMPVNFCTSCKCVLANEEVVNNVCERCGCEVVKKIKSQWLMKITQYADRLIDDLDLVDYPKRVKAQQINWIGKSKGAKITFKSTTETEDTIDVFTTRPETIFGATYLVLSPEHPLVKKCKKNILNFKEVEKYIQSAMLKSEIDRTDQSKEKTGVKLEGIGAIHPITGKTIDIFISDYVLPGYGEGAIMAVPAHDDRDNEFAKKFNLPIINVVNQENKLANSEFLNGKEVLDARDFVTSYIEKNEIGKIKTNYKLRDWIFSRQRYWGEPIPIIICDCCGHVPVPESELPVTLPDIEVYQPSEDGESPLSLIPEFVNTVCPKCGRPAKRETDTMPQWAGSCWYYLAYAAKKVVSSNAKIMDSQQQNLISEVLDYWTPVDWYNGGMEHTTLHLLYSRFWHKVLYDLKLVKEVEPYKKRTSHGMILGENSEKMSKSRGNVVNPDDIVSKYGADTLRLYEMFIGDFEKAAAWNDSGIRGCNRFLERVWGLKDLLVNSNEIRPDVEIVFNKTVKKVTDDIEEMKFNTAIAQLMSLINEIHNSGKITKKELEIFLLLLNPFAPHIAEELWNNTKFDGGYLFERAWPSYDPTKIQDDLIEIAVQINGKIKMRLNIKKDDKKDKILEIARTKLFEQNSLQLGSIVKEIYVPEKLINFVVR